MKVYQILRKKKEKRNTNSLHFRVKKLNKKNSFELKESVGQLKIKKQTVIPKTIFGRQKDQKRLNL